MNVFKYDDAFLSLPQLNIEDELSKLTSLYINFEPDFDPYQTAQSGNGVPFLFANILKNAGLDENVKFAIVTHYLCIPSTLHYHDYIEMIYIPKGKVLNIVNSTPHIMEDNSFLIIKPGVSHLIAPLPGDSVEPLIVNLLINPEFVRILAKAEEVCTDNALVQFLTTKRERNYLLLPNNTFTTASHILNLLVVEYYQNHYCLTLTMLGQFYMLLDCLSKFHQHPPHSYDKLSRRCISLIETHASTISLESLAQSLNYSEGYLSRHIKQQTGKTISQLITVDRMRLAERQLAGSELPVSEVAVLCGYQSESHFYRIFKQHFHITPNQYRNIMHRSKEKHNP